MILYTTMPQELIFPFAADSFQKHSTVMYDGIPLLVEQTDPQTLQVVRVLSTDPQHFLDERISPGTKISLWNIQGLTSL